MTKTITTPRQAPTLRQAFLAVALATGLTLALPAQTFASCGSAFCSMDTGWLAHDEMSMGGFSVDLKHDYIYQDKELTGDKAFTFTPEADTINEQKTINNIDHLLLDYSPEGNWGVSVDMPWITRFHEHTAYDATLTPSVEQWNFSQLGDVRVSGHWQLSEDTMNGWGLRAGLKLATGAFKVANAAGAVIDRSFQPGSGSNDLIFGLSYQQMASGSPMMWFTQVGFAGALDSQDHFRTGDRYNLDVGLNYHFSQALHLMVQLNASSRDRDSGLNADKDNSGGGFAYLSPGLGWWMLEHTQVYGGVQIPVYQYVNGQQMVFEQALTMGISQRF